MTRSSENALPRGFDLPGAAAGSGRRLCPGLPHDLRDRPGASAGAVAGRHAPVRAQHAGQPARDLLGRHGRRRRALGSVPVGLEPFALAARSDERGLGREPPLRQRQHRRRRRQPAAREAHAAGRRRAARHRLRARTERHRHRRSRAFITTAHRGQNSPRRSAAHHAPASAAPTSGCSTRASLGSDARRHAARRSSPCSATRRARWR